MAHVKLLIAAVLVAWAMPCAQAQSLPDTFASSYGVMREIGAGRLRYFGFHVYDAKLWADATPFSTDRRFALGLRYARNFRGVDIADRSAQEMRALGAGTESQLASWTSRMRTLFVDITPGDELVGVHDPNQGARFYLNGKRLGEINDPAFARAFFAIWLDPKTAAPELRAALLGGSR